MLTLFLFLAATARAETITCNPISEYWPPIVLKAPAPGKKLRATWDYPLASYERWIHRPVLHAELKTGQPGTRAFELRYEVVSHEIGDLWVYVKHRPVLTVDLDHPERSSYQDRMKRRNSFPVCVTYFDCAWDREWFGNEYPASCRIDP